MSGIAELALMVGPLEDTARRELIEERLTKRGIDYAVEAYNPFDAMPQERAERMSRSRDLPDIRDVWFDQGRNILIDLSPGEPAYLFCAHYDSTKTFDDEKRAAGQRPHYNDNAGSVAVLLGLIDDVYNSTIQPKEGIRIAFFDDEEMGLLGSRAYLLQDPERVNVEGVFNLELLAFGYRLAVARTCEKYEASPRILEISHRAAETTGIELAEEDSGRGDHLTFLEAGNPNATTFWSRGGMKKPNAPESIVRETLEMAYRLVQNVYRVV